MAKRLNSAQRPALAALKRIGNLRLHHLLSRERHGRVLKSRPTLPNSAPITEAQLRGARLGLQAAYAAGDGLPGILRDQVAEGVVVVFVVSRPLETCPSPVPTL